MRLSLIITTYRGSPFRQGSRQQIPPSGGTIGRAPDNDLVLEDPDRVVSGCHARVRLQDGAFYLDDLSRNGVFVNGAAEPVGRTRSARLSDGDVLSIGDYEILVEVAPAPSLGVGDPFAAAPSAAPAAGAGADPFAVRAEVAADDPFISARGLHARKQTTAAATPGAVIGERPVDPLELLGGAGRAAPLRRAGAQSDHAPPEAHHFEPPRVRVDPRTPRPITPPADAARSSGGGIPDDWFLTGIAPAPASSPPSGLAPRSPREGGATRAENAPGAPGAMRRLDESAPVEGHRSTPVVIPGVPDDWDLTGASEPPTQRCEVIADDSLPGARDLPSVAAAQGDPALGSHAVTRASHEAAPEAETDAFATRALAAAGLSLPDGSLPSDLPEALGGLLTALADGFVQLLAGRSTFKNELRLQATSIQPVENNPLKFSNDGAQALGHLLFPSGAGFRGPVESVEEVVCDLKDHQVATIAAMRAALDELLRRLDPDVLEARWNEAGKVSRLGLSGKGRYWDAYRELMASFRSDPEAFFDENFADVFVDAYERQIDLLSRSPR